MNTFLTWKYAKHVYCRVLCTIHSYLSLLCSVFVYIALCLGVCVKICALRDSRWQFLVRYNDDVSVYTSLKCMSVAVAAWTVAVQFFSSHSVIISAGFMRLIPLRYSLSTNFSSAFHKLVYIWSTAICQLNKPGFPFYRTGSSYIKHLEWTKRINIQSIRWNECTFWSNAMFQRNKQELRIENMREWVCPQWKLNAFEFWLLAIYPLIRQHYDA